jgi:hypothetical protein
MKIGRLGLALLVIPVAAQTQAKNASPTDVVRQFFKAEDDGRWLDAARLLDLNAFEAYRQTALLNASMSDGRTGPTPEQLMARDSAMPRAVAEYLAKQYSGMRVAEPLGREFARTVSADTLRALPRDEAAARWLEARDRRWQFQWSIAQLGPECQKPPGGSVPPEPAKVVLGPAVMPTGSPSDTLSYVVFTEGRSNPAGRVYQGATPGVVVLRRIGSDWRIVPLPDLGYVGGIRSYLGVGCTRVNVQTTK